MDIYIIDTNLVFSAILNIEHSIGQFILSAHNDNIEFYAPGFLHVELERYIPKLVELSKMEEGEIRRIIALLYSKINFIADHLIPFEFYQKAVPYVREVDMDDLVFVALNDFLHERLWTGDLKLYKELKSKGYDRVVTFEDIQSELKK